MIRAVSSFLSLVAAVAAQEPAARSADSFAPPGHLGEGQIDVAAARECGLLAVLREWLATTEFADLEERMGLSFDDVHRLRVWVGQSAREGGPPDLRQAVAVFEGSDALVLPAAVEGHERTTIAGYPALQHAEEGRDSQVRVGIRPGLLVSGSRRLVEPLLAPGKEGKPDARLRAIAKERDALLYFTAMLPAPAPADAAAVGEPDLLALRLRRVDGDGGELLRIELVVHCAGKLLPRELFAGFESRRKALLADEQVAAHHAVLRRIELEHTATDVMANLELGNGRELLDTVRGLGPVLTRSFRGARADLAQAKVEKAQAVVIAIYNAAKIYRIMKGGWPSLADLVQPDANGRIRLDPVGPDPWGNEYLLRQDGNRLTVLSRGPDGVEVTADDIANQR